MHERTFVRLSSKMITFTWPQAWSHSYLCPRSPVFLLDYFWDLHSVWHTPNWEMQCRYLETKATWEAVAICHDVTWRGSSLSFRSGITISAHCYIRGNRVFSEQNAQSPVILLQFEIASALEKIKLKMVQLTFSEGRSEALTGNFVHLHVYDHMENI